jgi:hypothetical protein
MNVGSLQIDSNRTSPIENSSAKSPEKTFFETIFDNAIGFGAGLQKQLGMAPAEFAPRLAKENFDRIFKDTPYDKYNNYTDALDAYRRDCKGSLDGHTKNSIAERIFSSPIWNLAYETLEILKKKSIEIYDNLGIEEHKGRDDEEKESIVSISSEKDSNSVDFFDPKNGNVSSIRFNSLENSTLSAAFDKDVPKEIRFRRSRWGRDFALLGVGATLGYLGSTIQQWAQSSFSQSSKPSPSNFKPQGLNLNQMAAKTNNSNTRPSNSR